MDLKEFKFSKRWGQNFITDTNLLKSIVADAGITAGDTVLEIGAGAGTLTRQLALTARRVVAWEIDTALADYIGSALTGLNNVKVEYGDYLKAEQSYIYDVLGGRDFKVVANLPYYITTPILFGLMDMESPPKSITVMVQLEVAKRLTARADTPEYGALTVAAAAYGEAVLKRTVRKELFVPRPQVDSGIVRLDYKPDNGINNKRIYDRLVRSAFHMRRKTLVNNLAADFGLTKPDAQKLLGTVGLDANIRGEAVTVQGFVALANALSDSPPYAGR